MKYGIWKNAHSSKNYILHVLIRVLGFPFIFLICYGVILWQYRTDPYGYGAMMAMVSATFVAVLYLLIETVWLMWKRNKKYLINIVLLLILLLIGLVVYQ